MHIEKLLPWVSILSTVLVLIWNGTKRLVDFINQTSDSRDPKIRKLHNRVSGWTLVLATLGFSIMAWGNFLHDQNLFLKAFNLGCSVIALFSAGLFAVFQHKVWADGYYFGRLEKMEPWEYFEPDRE